MMSTKGILIAIFVILLAILAVLAIEAADDSPTEEVAESVNDLSEKMADEIDNVNIPQ